MILAGQQCSIFDGSKTTIQLAMEMSTDSAGYPKWYNLGDNSTAYDSTRIKLRVVSDTPVALEAIVREQYTGSQIDITFEAGEWLYEYTAGFVILKHSIKERLDTDFKSYLLELEIAPVAPIPYNTIQGSRDQCVGSGYINYAGAYIPQPKKYSFQYNGHKYAGTTNGSAYSSELPTIRHDSTSFSVEAYASETRALVDKLYIARGSEVSVSFPENAFPFGLSRGSASIVNNQFVPSGSTIEIETSDSCTFTTKIGLIDLQKA